jgi:glyceraldehyde 3-phosphate dehydrogenase
LTYLLIIIVLSVVIFIELVIKGISYSFPFVPLSFPYLRIMMKSGLSASGRDGVKGVNVGINGFGRIGRLLLRSWVYNQDRFHFQITAINDPLLDIDSMIYLFKHDSIHGRFPGDVVKEGKDGFKVGNHFIKVSHVTNVNEIPWKNGNVEVVAETSGKNISSEKCQGHFQAEGTVKQVIISAPSEDNKTPLFVLGVNHKDYHPNMKIVSNGSCTTNALAALAKLLNDNYGIEAGIMTTVHAMTASQNVVDGPTHHHSGNLRAGRCASRNIIPFHTGATEAIGNVLPELQGKLTSMGLRVPVENVSVLDLTCQLSRGMNNLTDFADMIDTITKDKNHELCGIVGVTNEPVVSSDFIGDTRSFILDLNASVLLNPTFVKLIAYYDNEWAYAARLVSCFYYLLPSILIFFSFF